MISVHAGDKLDHYRIESLVARSGMASIFRATDLRDGRTVAIKIPHPEMECDPVFFERFQREEEIGRKLDHPGVMKVYANDQRQRTLHGDGVGRGRLLRQLVNESASMPPERAVDIVAAASAMRSNTSTRNGVIHRDLKPENIMIDEHDSIKLIDFGIAGNIGSRRITFAKLSDAMGTPDYISPEQVQGSAATPAATCTPSASCSTRCSPARCRSPAPIPSSS